MIRRIVVLLTAVLIGLVLVKRLRSGDPAPSSSAAPPPSPAAAVPPMPAPPPPPAPPPAPVASAAHEDVAPTPPGGADSRTRLRLRLLADQARSRGDVGVADAIDRFVQEHPEGSEDDLRPAAQDLLDELRGQPDVSAFIREALVLPRR